MARARRDFRQGPRRGRGWASGPGGTAITTVSSTSEVFLGAALEVVADGQTLARTRGRLLAQLDVAAAIGEGFTGAFGIGVATFAAVTAGINSVPTPITEQDWDGWLFWSAIQVIAGDASDVGLSRGATQIIDVDSKAMRKLKDDMAIYACVDMVEIGTSQVRIFFDSRMLFLLP